MESFEKQLYRLHGDTIQMDPLFETIQEVTQIEFGDGKMIALKSLDSELSMELRTFYL